MFLDRPGSSESAVVLLRERRTRGETEQRLPGALRSPAALAGAEVAPRRLPSAAADGAKSAGRE